MGSKVKHLKITLYYNLLGCIIEFFFTIVTSLQLKCVHINKLNCTHN